MSLAVVYAYEMDLEVSKGELDHTWKDNNIFDFWKFCYLLFNKMIKYNPMQCKYAGDANMRPATHQNQDASANIKYDSRFKRGR